MMFSKLLGNVAKSTITVAHSRAALSLCHKAAAPKSVATISRHVLKLYNNCRLLSASKRFFSKLTNLALVGVTVCTLPPLVWCAQKAEEKKMARVKDRLEKGNLPPVDYVRYYCEREKELSKLKDAILSTEARNGTSGLFFIVVGPNGCGKSSLMKKLCEHHPKGLIYYQVYDSKSFAIGLGKACGMSFEMKGNICEVIVGWGNLPYKSWFTLPESPEAALSYVIEVLEEQGQKFRSKHHEIPSIIIDSVEIIAKTDHELFKHLIRLSKRVVNDGSLNIVLVSSEGLVVPTVKRLAEKSRIKELYVEDISEKKALDMLRQGELSEDISRQLVKISGPRLQYLKRIQASAHLCGFPTVSGDALVKCIKNELTKEAQNCIRQAKVHKASETFKTHKAILQLVLKREEESRATIEYEICKQLKDRKLEEVQACIQDLLHANILTIEDEKIKFHSRLLQTYIEKFLATDKEQPVELS